MWPAIGAIGSGIAGLLGSVWQNSAQQASADKAMQFEAQQSSTAHQREVADLKAAGLNPILSAGGSGAASAMGVQANVTNPGQAAVQAAESGSNSAAKLSTVDAQIENLKADTKLKGDTQAAQKASAVQSLAQARLAAENSATTAAVRNSVVEKANYDAGISANAFGAGLGDTSEGKLKKAYLESGLGSWLRQIGAGGADVGKALQGVSSAAGLALLK